MRLRSGIKVEHGPESNPILEPLTDIASPHIGSTAGTIVQQASSEAQIGPSPLCSHSFIASDSCFNNTKSPKINKHTNVNDNSHATDASFAGGLPNLTTNASSASKKRKGDDFFSDDLEDELSDVQIIQKKQKLSSGPSQSASKASLEHQKRLAIDEAIDLLRNYPTPTTSATKRKRSDTEYDAVELQTPIKRVKSSADVINLVETKGNNGKRLRRRVKPVPSKVELEKPVKGSTIFPFLKLPVEIQHMILQHALVADGPVQPTEKTVVKGAKTPNIGWKDKTQKMWRRPLDLNVALLRTCKHIYTLARPILFSNTLDLSTTEWGGMTSRTFRRSIKPEGQALVQHVVISSRMVTLRHSSREDDDDYDGPIGTSHTRRAQRNSDKEFVCRLRDGDVISNIARFFPRLQTLQVRMNALNWSPAQKVHFDLFGPKFKGITVVTGKPGSEEEVIVARYDAAGERAVIPTATVQNNMTKKRKSNAKNPTA